MLIDNELNKLNLMLSGIFDKNSVHIAEEINRHLHLKSKRLRPALMFLFAKSLDIEIQHDIYNAACAYSGAARDYQSRN